MTSHKQEHVGKGFFPMSALGAKADTISKHSAFSKNVLVPTAVSLFVPGDMILWLIF